jgi:hypothetical protein
MSLQTRLERLEHANTNNAPVIVWREWDETVEGAVARWRGRGEDPDCAGRACVRRPAVKCQVKQRIDPHVRVGLLAPQILDVEIAVFVDSSSGRSAPRQWLMFFRAY